METLINPNAGIGQITRQQISPAPEKFPDAGLIWPIPASGFIKVSTIDLSDPVSLEQAAASIDPDTHSSTVDFWIMYKNLHIHAMRATFHIVFSVRI